MRRLLPTLALLVLLGAGCRPAAGPSTSAPPAAKSAHPTGKRIATVENASFTFNGRPVPFTFGQGMMPSAAGAPTSTLRVFGMPAVGDLDGDGTSDTATFIVQQRQDGAAYYVAAALSAGGAMHGTDAVPLGDGVAPLRVQIQSGRLFVDFLQRKPGEAASVAPTAGASRVFVVKGDVLEEVKSPPAAAPH